MDRVTVEWGACVSNCSPRPWTVGGGFLPVVAAQEGNRKTDCR